ncbi:ATP-binding protein [Streptomyces cyaneofuscatus]|uniref:ATP-binding protein n=1 Tax=Streptomyces cyaneofuscatus TaxID=66883 RepID=UPI0036597A69
MPVTAEPDPPDYRQDLVAHPESLVIMRRIVSAHVDLWGFRELSESVTLCAHELLANVDRHTGSPHRTITLRRRPDGVRVTVTDTNTDPPASREPDEYAEGGRGLALISGIAEHSARSSGGTARTCGPRSSPHVRPRWRERPTPPGLLVPRRCRRHRARPDPGRPPHHRARARRDLDP